MGRKRVGKNLIHTYSLRDAQAIVHSNYICIVLTSHLTCLKVSGTQPFNAQHARSRSTLQSLYCTAQLSSP
jgi:hypothetical protein